MPVRNRKEYMKNYNERNHDVLQSKRYDYREKNKYIVWARNTIINHSKFDISITPEELATRAENTKICIYCGCLLRFGPKGRKGAIPESPSLDRRDNEKSIDMNNIDIICHRCGSTKRDRTQKEFIDYCIAVAKKYGE